MQVAIVGSRKGADLNQVRHFVTELMRKHPDTILVSGGADGVDKTAETLWIELGGRVLSYRAREDQHDPERWVITEWKLGSWDRPMVRDYPGQPSFANAVSALFYRDALIAELSDKVVAFFGHYRTSGTQSTLDFAVAEGRDTYEYFARAA